MRVVRASSSQLVRLFMNVEAYLNKQCYMLDNSSYQHLSLQITTTMKIAQILVETDADLNSFSYSVLALVLSTKRANVELARYFVNVDLDVNATM